MMIGLRTTDMKYLGHIFKVKVRQTWLSIFPEGMDATYQNIGQGCGAARFLKLYSISDQCNFLYLFPTEDLLWFASTFEKGINP